MLENRRRIDKIPGLPNLKITTAAEYFRKLHETVEETDQYVHTWDGELYLEYHRGTYTSQGYNKRMNRKKMCIRDSPDNVTLFGQSGGGAKVLALMTLSLIHI